MKSIVVASVLTLLIFTGFIMTSNKQEYYQSKGEQLVNNILGKTTKTIDEKYNVKSCGVGAAMPGGPIQELTLCFNTKSPYTKEQLRELLIKSAQELLKQVNENNEIQEFLKEPPFNLKNVQIVIYNSDINGREVYDPGISTAEISQGTLTYQTVDFAQTFKYKKEIKETFEEALKALSAP